MEEGRPRAPKETPRLLVKYRKEVLPKLKEKYGHKNDLACARLRKICVNIGIGKMLGSVANEADKTKIIEESLRDLALITGQKAVVTLARKSVSNFKVRKGFRVGVRATLRGARMYEFFDRLVSVAIPRIRDFRGISPRSFDGRGNFSLGLQEKTIFPEVDVDKVNYHQGLQVTIVTTAKTDEEARDLLRGLGMPFREN
ncbi:MAG: 50S ribosomal protein L5 [Planctomycetota bacterium]|nr:50S ribosomal protein L5 [Planctomycetota bacterium]